MTSFSGLIDAVIFASGAATRAASYSEGRSKCLLPLPDGDAVLDKIMDWLATPVVHSVTLLTTFDKHGVPVQEYARSHQVASRLRFVSEERLGGTVSALRAYATTFPPRSRPTLLLNHDTILTIPFLDGMVKTFAKLHADVLDARGTRSGVSSGVRLLSQRALVTLTDPGYPWYNVEDAIHDPLIYPVLDDDAFVDVGTEAGYRRACELYGG